MTILRIDAWQVRPGSQAEVVEFATRMKAQIERCGGKSPRLMRVIVGGPSTGLTYGEFQAATLEEHGRIIGKLTDDDVMQQLSRFYRSDGPVIAHEAAQAEVIAELGKRTASIPGCVEIIQNFKIANDRIGDYLELAGELAAITDGYDARLRVLHGLTGSVTGQIGQVVEFADMAAFGRYAADVWPQPAFQDLVGKVRSVARHLDGSLHAEVAT
ncbi:MAG: hypothetical protein R3A46_06950 [Thermomicrobiales bacterium]